MMEGLVGNPPKRGFRLLPSILDYLGTVSPDKVYASIPRGQDISNGFRDISTRELLHAVDSFAWWIQNNYGASDCFETLGYIGVADLRYVMFFHAAVKCGYKALFVSQRNSEEQNASLIHQTGCRLFFHSIELTKAALRIQGETAVGALQLVAVPEFDEWVKSYTTPFPYRKLFEDARYDPILVLHSSGSTGAPKPITLNHQFFANYDRPLPPIEDTEIGGIWLFEAEGGGNYFSPFPLFHLGGFSSGTVWPLFFQTATLVMGYSDRPATAKMVHQAMTKKKIRLLYCPPSIIEQLMLIPDIMDYVKILSVVIYAGGPLNKSCGNKLAEHVKLTTVYGSTETGTVVSLYSGPADWQYLEFHPAWKVSMEPVIENAYELVINSDSEADQYRPIGGTILREATQYRSKDLFLAHPVKPGLWTFYGRSDDIIVLSNGEKWNPVPSERIISEHPKVSGVLIVGNGRFQPAALIELKDYVRSSEFSVEDIWAYVEMANRQAQKHGRLVRSKVIVAEKGSFIRTPKGTIVRSSTIRQLEGVIEEVFSEVDHRNCASASPALLRPYDSQNAIFEFVQLCLQQIRALEDIKDDDDFFIHGLDSLGAIEIATLIKSGLKRQLEHERLSFISPQLVFDAPSIQKLSIEISKTLSPRLLPSTFISDSNADVSTIDDFTRQIPIPGPEKRQPQRTENLQVILTGSTGFLGRNLLQILLFNPRITKVYCFNRDPHAEVVARKVLSLPESVWSKAIFMTVEFGEVGFGLSKTDIRVFDEVDLILHCAWKVNFNHSLASFEPQIHAVTHFISLVGSSSRTIRFFFVSSISSMSNYRASSGHKDHIPEEILDDKAVALPMGYAQSKHIAERMLAIAAERIGVTSTLLRVGQIAGTVRLPDDDSPHRSAEALPWNKDEWVPAMIRTSKNLGQLPLDQPPVDWIPVNKLALIIMDLVTFDLSSNKLLAVYNLVNPHPAAWSSLLPAIAAGLGPSCRIISFNEWLNALKSHDPENKDNVERYPALKLMAYFDKMLGSLQLPRKVSVENAMLASSAFSRLEPVNADWMEQWMKQWGFAGEDRHGDC